jgi:hypothetical protein
LQKERRDAGKRNIQHHPIGRRRVMDDALEDELTKVTCALGEMDFCMTYNKFGRFVERFCEKRFEKLLEEYNAKTPAQKKRCSPPKPFFQGGSGLRRHNPGRWWVRSFIKRHPELTVKLSSARRLRDYKLTKTIMSQ